ncbi:uncharacterized protein N7473_012790 [Penicillium subrubescens]|uniref:Methyltransferase type 11 domain-containing protein n=1 Tax=Penicillium subrubescens TaxID=1316194 RepID=A0A1Q5UGJ1_9EURO|nr:uncharacterized protein N7473_012790 [Penicillium subrubescens]KAJ5875443.1 hypothetical protein N7473_012790 [Penicillium subrubescens]OKP11607.1 hypothetical protein PENSUB_2909 [Penicillium subrubescens]
MNIRWLQGSASELQTIPELATKEVDLIILSAGSFSHLYEPGQPEEFLNQVALVLKPETGRACIPLANSFIPKGGREAQLPDIDAPQQLVSKEFPNVVYQTSIVGGKTVGSTYHERRDMFVTRKLEDGNEPVIERNCVSTPVRLWCVNEFMEMACNAGFNVVQHLQGQEETYFTTSWQGLNMDGSLWDGSLCMIMRRLFNILSKKIR